MKPKVSVLLSVYNSETTISRCIESIIKQTYEDFELVIINDGSTDCTESLIKSFKDDRIRFFNPGRLGLARALNFGLSKCRGDFIARMDADDWCYLYRLAHQVEYLNTHPETHVVSSLIEYVGDRKKNEGYALHVDWINQLITHEQMYINRFEDAPIANPSCMFRSSLIDKYGNYSEGPIPEDYEFWLRLMEEGVQFGKVNKVLFRWSDIPDRLTRTSNNYSQQAFFEVKASYFMSWLYKTFDKLPEIYVFGTGKTVNRKLKPFESLGLKVHGYLEVKVKNNYPTKTIHYSQLPPSDGNQIVLSFIGDRDGKRQIEHYLKYLGYNKGQSYFMMS